MPSKKSKVISHFEPKDCFSRPCTTAEFEYYCRFSYWEVDEAVALSLGKNPKTVNWQKIQESPEDIFAKRYERQRVLVTRAKLSDMSPSTILNWMNQRRIKIPKDLVAAAVNAGISLGGSRYIADSHTQFGEGLAKKESEPKEARAEIADLKEQSSEAASASEKNLGPRERDTLQIMLSVVSIVALGFHPEKRNKASKRIDDLLASVGHTRSRKTIHDHLKRGSDNLQPAQLVKLESEHQEFLKDPVKFLQRKS